ncbi:hypothetical protein [Lentilactobacillus sp. Marseille-Q4993]|uniref:hypothetical protein n=1 Tax=Lentilactobacillus sp. Marseille-Q4993 TaxID=3039492 RepID=UPI0024BBF293|nr:hypothetical protein [Lentilactobacillus sp. Marseille-Q4993]
MQDPWGNGNNNNDDDNNNGMLPIPPNYATVVNKETGEIRIAKVGFSFTALFFFGFLPAVFRSDWYNFFCMVFVDFILYMGTSMIFHIPLIDARIAVDYFVNIIWAFLYNMMYFKHLFNKGYVPADERSKELLVQANYLKIKSDDDQDNQ